MSEYLFAAIPFVLSFIVVCVIFFAACRRHQEEADAHLRILNAEAEREWAEYEKWNRLGEFGKR